MFSGLEHQACVVISLAIFPCYSHRQSLHLRQEKGERRANGDDGVCSSLAPLTHNGLVLLTVGKPMRVLPLLDRMTTHIINSHNPTFYFLMLHHF